MAQTASSHPAKASASSHTTLTVAAADVVPSIDPLNAATSNSEPASLPTQVLYDTLVVAKIPSTFAAARAAYKLGGPVVPELASSWTISGKKLVMKLNTAATSNFGKHLTADDVVWSFGRMKTAKSGIAGYFLGAGGYTGIKKINSSTVEMTFNRPVPSYFLHILTMMPFGIYDSVAAKKHATSADPWADAWLNKHDAGFGPYTLASFNQDGGVTLTARTNYIVNPQIKKIIQLAVPDSSNRLQLVLSGAADFADQLSPSQLKQLNDSGKVGTYVTGINSATAFLAMNNSLPAFKTPQLRRAIAEAIPYSTLLNNVYFGKALQWKTLIEPWFQGATDQYWTYKEDPAAAKAVLSTLSPSDRTISLAYESGNQLAQQMAVLIASALNNVGLNVTATEEPVSDFSQKRIFGGYQMWLDNLSGASPASSVLDLGTFFGSKGLLNTAYQYAGGKAIDTFIAHINLSKTPAQQNAWISAAQKQLVSDLPFIPLAYSGTNAGYAKYVGGVTQSEWGSWDYRYFTLN